MVLQHSSHTRPSLKPPPALPLQGSESISTATHNGYLQLVLDARQQVQSLVYCGPKHWTASRVQSIIGLPASYLKQIHTKYILGEILDLVEFLEGPWMDILYHDQFPALRASLQAAVLREISTPGGNTAAALARAQDAVTAFVKSKTQDLPNYNVFPAFDVA